MGSTPTLPADFVDLLTEFADADVRYLVIGGYAVGFHHRPRATKDLDLLVESTPENVERTCRALSAFGAPPDVVEAFQRAGPEEIVWFGAPPLRVDLLKSAGPVPFSAAYERRATFTSATIDVPIVALEDLIAMKRAAARDQDRVDVRRLEQVALARRNTKR
jgi:predicted nucleotidyltransferase